MGIIVLSKVIITWMPFVSTVYPYAIMQPSSFQHLLVHGTSDTNVDYFFGAQGSSVTNVNIDAVPGQISQSPRIYLQKKDARHIRKGGTVTILGEKRRLWDADFHGLAGPWTVETTSFAARGWIWKLTISYEKHTQKLRPIMMRMLQSFKIRGP
ncbi:MAG: hypothetical protein NVSMB52_06510 [Chloroflexota bacterium]